MKALRTTFALLAIGLGVGACAALQGLDKFEKCETDEECALVDAGGGGRLDGTIPDDQQKLLLAIGSWLDVNGEAIYGTRPWKQWSENKVRFTKKGAALYAISFDWPASEEIEIAALGKNAGAVEKVEMLGHDGTLEFTQTDTGLKVKLPADKPCQHAWSLKISTQKHN